MKYFQYSVVNLQRHVMTPIDNPNENDDNWKHDK